MCRDLIRYVVDLCGYEFLEQEVAYYKHRAAAPQPLAYPLPGPPALIPVPIKQEEIVVVDAAPAPAPALILPAVIEAVVQPPAPENRVVEISAPVAAHAAVVATAPKERSRYKRTELADEARCTANTTRGTRCTLERETGKTVCSRHVSST
jgi:hypothetical protein